IQHYARDSYEEFDGDESSQGDAVEISTIHQSKGLEWPVVFMPALDSRRFPSSNAGKGRNWLLPLDLFPEASRSRYEGGDQEERRLFYVAMTRARDTLYLSHYRKINKASRASRYLVELVGEKSIKPLTELPLHDGPPSPNAAEHDKVSVSFSELSDFDDCGHRYRLSAAMGFETQLVSELGYGRAIHHVLRSVAETARAQGSPPSEAAVQAILDREFYLPFANAANFETMRASAQAMVHMYVRKYRDDLTRIWATERPFEMHLAGGTLSGRADVILSHHEGRPDSLAIVDYKTAKDTTQDAAFAFQLAIYAAAGRGEGLQIDAALLHDLKRERRDEVDISPEATRKAVAKVDAMMTDLRQGNYLAKPEQRKCGACEYCKLCPHAIVDPWDRD
ncbi:MAG: PD-(D/E)XK nuclease family protein, partial [Phycisphaerales bacterium]